MSVDDPHVIDFVAQDPDGTVVLVMVEGREWDASDRRLFELQEKINAYAAFATDGQLIAHYHELAGKPIRLELRCVDEPEPKTAAFLEMARQKLEDHGLPFGFRRIRGTSPA